MSPTAAPHAGRTAAELADLLLRWLPEQRWYGGKDERLDAVVLESTVRLRAGDSDADEPALWHVVAATYPRGGGTMPSARYQVLIGFRRDLPDRLHHALIGALDTWPGTMAPGHAVAYDATHDPTLTAWLLRWFAGERSVGPVAFRLVPGADLHRRLSVSVGHDLSSLVHSGEQSNTSVIYGSALILKLFRRLVPGVNPDLELALALSRAGSTHIPEPIGWIDAELPDSTTGTAPVTTLGILQEYLPTATDGWVLAQTSVRDLYADPEVPAAMAGGDFAPEAHRLGAATAEVHRDLAETLPVEHLDGERLDDLVATMTSRLDEAIAAAPQLTPYRKALGAAYLGLRSLSEPLRVQRIHGDYHLGQVMRTPLAWILLDFEGEPTRPLTERRALSSPLRDVAAMLRSFDYASHHLLATMMPPAGSDIDPRLRARATEWAERNRDAFCAGYGEVAGVDPRQQTTVLRAFEIDKAVYEVVYETRSRPAWVGIPMAAVRRLAGGSTA
jgi:maltokinase